ncbi:MAG: AmmeMemoRadiSam system radical SAM enzyme [Vulcanimicrobiota bacterium]
MECSRRHFLRAGAAFTAGCLFAGGGSSLLLNDHREALAAGASGSTAVREAMFYEKQPGGIAHCTLCPCSPLDENCGFLKDGDMCVCNVRFNKGGKLYVSNYGKPSTIHIDPIEKNPIYHMTPGKNYLALATAGCNLDCRCCQNWEMSQRRVEQVKNFSLQPGEIVKKAGEHKCRGISYTYTEPVIFYEYMLDIAKIACGENMINTMVTGGYILPEPLRLLTKYVQGFSVSIKGFTEDFYRSYCRGKLSTVLNALKVLRGKNVWVEVVVLVIPTLSDRIAEIEWFCQWMKDNMGPMVPIHFTRFWPSYQLRNLPQTPVTILEKAWSAAKSKGLKYVYLGNVPGHEKENTFCHNCGTLLIGRMGMKLKKNIIARGKCPSCRTAIPGMWT